MEALPEQRVQSHQDLPHDVALAVCGRLGNSLSLAPLLVNSTATAPGSFHVTFGSMTIGHLLLRNDVTWPWLSDCSAVASEDGDCEALPAAPAAAANELLSEERLSDH